MMVVRVETNGTVTAVWSGHVIRDAFRGFYKGTMPVSPSGKVSPLVVDGHDYGDLNAHEIRMVQDFRKRRANAVAESRRLA